MGYISEKKKYGLYAKTYSEAKEKLIKKSNMPIETIYGENEKIVFEDTSDIWLNNIRNNLKESSVSKYENILNKHIHLIFANRRIDDITNVEVEAFLNSLLKGIGFYDRRIIVIFKALITIFKHIIKYLSQNIKFCDT